jgi:hypothetical protein
MKTNKVKSKLAFKQHSTSYKTHLKYVMAYTKIYAFTPTKLAQYVSRWQYLPWLTNFMKPCINQGPKFCIMKFWENVWELRDAI